MGRLRSLRYDPDGSIAAQIWRDAELIGLSPDQLNARRRRDAQIFAGARHIGDTSGQGSIAVSVAMDAIYNDAPTVDEPESTVDRAKAVARQATTSRNDLVTLEAVHALDDRRDEDRDPVRPKQFADTTACAVGVTVLGAEAVNWRDDSWYFTFRDIQALKETQD